MRRLIDRLSIACGWALVVYCLAVGVEIVGRRFLGFSLQGVDEIGGYLMAVLVAIGFTAAVLHQAHIRIDILLPYLPRRLGMWLNVAALASLCLFAMFLVWRGWIVLADSHAISAVAPTPLLTPLVVPQSLWVAGLVLFAAAALVVFSRALIHGAKGEIDQVADLAGSSAGIAPSRGDRP
ncbi:MAG: TRAP transporter small permease [Alphaproteobacteria bacterium]|nr:TRAP transporter small permease [Alphaproteobacteria bacterium]